VSMSGSSAQVVEEWRGANVDSAWRSRMQSRAR
jgi:hypothetical protein